MKEHKSCGRILRTAGKEEACITAVKGRMV